MGHKHSFRDCLLELIVYLSKRKFHLCEFDPNRVTAYFSTVSHNGVTIKGDIEMAELREGQRIPVSVAFKTANGKPAVYQAGTATFESSDPAARFDVDPADELKGYLVGVDGSNNASGTLTFRADGDPDADQVRELVATLDFVVTQGEAVVAEITAGPAEDNPAIPTPGPEPEPAPAEPVEEAPPVPTENPNG